jgi:hypothetical protein
MNAPKLRHSHLGGFFRFTQSTTPAAAPVFNTVTGEPFKQSAELTREPIKMKG